MTSVGSHEYLLVSVTAPLYLAIIRHLVSRHELFRVHSSWWFSYSIVASITGPDYFVVLTRSCITTVATRRLTDLS